MWYPTVEKPLLLVIFSLILLRKQVVRPVTAINLNTDHNADYTTTEIGIPLQMTTDKGSEIGWEYAFQVALRCVFVHLTF
jgi:hypothetical protein